MSRSYDEEEWQWIVSVQAASFGSALTEILEESSDAAEWLVRDDAEPLVRFEVTLGDERLDERAFFERAATQVELHPDLARFIEQWSTLAKSTGERVYAWHDDLRPAGYYAAFTLGFAAVEHSSALETFVGGIDPLYPVFLPRPLLAFFHHHGWRPETLTVLAAACAHDRRAESPVLRATVFHLGLREHLLESGQTAGCVDGVLDRLGGHREDEDRHRLESQLFVGDERAYREWRERQQELIERWRGRTELGQLADFAEPDADWDVL